MIPYDVPQWIVLVWLFTVGAVIGSFLNVCIYRIPQHESLWASLRGLYSPPSYCPRCRQPISPWDNIPIFGWLKLRGRCRNCHLRISPRYPLIELFNGLLFVVMYWFEVPAGFGATIQESGIDAVLGPKGIPGSDWLSPTAVVNWRYAYHMVLLEALLVASFIDIDLKIIPDGVTVPAMLVGLVGAAVVGQVYLVLLWFQDPSVVRSIRTAFPESLQWLLTGPRVPQWFAEYPHWHGFLVSLAGLIVGGGTVWIVRLLGFWILRQEAMGFGDVVLMAAIGSYLGWQPTLIVFFLAPVCALAVVLLSLVLWRGREIPYGPYLSLATLLLLLGWKQIWPIAERVFSLGPVLIVIAVFMTAMLAASLQLMQLLKLALGIPLYPSEAPLEEWTSADQLAFFANENVDLQRGRWPHEEWQGTSAGRGTVHEDAWRNGCRDSWTQDWERRH